ncbi:hypothetical protein [Promicromonospora kroppenstedtii]|uniref:hypothetical protein n=1 Tax=Promicromonospora kroppenstedtii TaxID=440482 RepID=UPI0005669B33|nr:hypothetical protein [Promicromonospora kroppenstedtii]
MIGILDWDIRANGVTLPATGGSINIDDQNVPAISATVVVPYDADLEALLDPRSTVVPRVTLNGRMTEWAAKTVADLDAYFAAEGRTTAAGVTLEWAGKNVGDITMMFGRPLYDLARYEPQKMSLDLHVREISHDGFEMSISLASDEALLTDWAITSGQDMFPINDAMAGANPQHAGPWVNAVISAVLGYGLTPGVYDTTPLSTTYTDVLDWTMYTSAWDMFRPVLEDTDLKLRVGPTGRGFTLERPENSINNPATHSWLFTDEDVTTVRHVKSRTGDWYDSALLQRADHTWTGGYPNPGLHSRTYIETVPDTVKPSFSMAQNIARRSVNRGQFIDITAPIQLGVFMRDEFAYAPTLDDTPEQWIVKSVTYDLLAGTMNIRGEQRY